MWLAGASTSKVGTAATFLIGSPLMWHMQQYLWIGLTWPSTRIQGGGSFQKAGASVIDNLPYALPIVAACLLVMVIIAVRILRKTQPQSTSYINAALNNVSNTLILTPIPH